MPNPIGPNLTVDERHSRRAPEGVYSRLTIGGVRFRLLCLRQWPTHGSFSVVTLVDDLLADRADTLMRFGAALQHRRPMRGRRPTASRRHILRQMLQAIDAREAGATYQEIATVLFRISPVSAIAWKTMSERDTVMRRVRDGLKFVNGDYRNLLRHHRPR